MQTLILRLVSGEELIGKVSFDEETGSYTIQKPFILIPVGEGKIGFAPYMGYANHGDGLEISEIFVMFQTEPVKEMEAKYIEASTGIFTGGMGAGPIIGNGLRLSE
jgi:hypothetical protein